MYSGRANAERLAVLPRAPEQKSGRVHARVAVCPADAQVHRVVDSCRSVSEHARPALPREQESVTSVDGQYCSTSLARAGERQRLRKARDGLLRSPA